MAALVALPLVSVTGLPKGEPSIENWTVPVRVPAPGDTAFTVAVKVTDWPNTEGLTDEVTVVVVLAGLTVWVKGEAVLSLPLKLLSVLTCRCQRRHRCVRCQDRPKVQIKPRSLIGSYHGHRFDTLPVNARQCNHAPDVNMALERG